MNRARLLALGILFTSTIAVTGCSSDGDEADEKVVRGTAAAGAVCTVSNDCAEATALCAPTAGAESVCTEKLGADAFTLECDQATVAACPAYACIVLPTNAQAKTGICSMSCTSDAQCGANAVCSKLGEGSGCLHACTSSGNCANGFVCVADPGNAARKVCLVELGSN